MKKRKISYEWWEAVVEIADDAEGSMKEQLLFWLGGQEMIDDADGDVELAYLRMLGRELVRESMDLTLPGILKEWETREGWAPLDGSCGVTLVSMDTWEFHDDDFSVSEI